MKNRILTWCRTFFEVLPILLAMACADKPPPTALTPEELPGVIETAFAKAPPEVKSVTVSLVQAVREKNYVQALALVQNLSRSAGLNADQREVAARALLTINGQLRAARDKGDPVAEQVLKIQQMTK